MERLIQSVVDDIMYNASHGHLKPNKHICLALTITSLTGSHKIIEILNMISRSCLCTSLAFGIYDEQSETLSGHGTLHDTVGICYQNKLEGNNVEMTSDAEDSSPQEVPS